MLNKSGKKNLSLTTLAATAAVLANGAQAAHASSVNVQNYNTAANSTYTMTEDAMMQVAPNDPSWYGMRLFFSAQYNWVNDPLIQYNSDRTVRDTTLVDSIQTLDLTAGWFLDRRFSLNYSAPLNIVHMSSQANQFGLGDSRAFAKWRLTDDNAIVAVSIIPELWLPTGDATLFLSDGSMGYGGSLAFEHDFGPVRAAANIGYRYSPNAQFMDIDYSQRLPMALGLYAPLGPRWGINAEASGALVLPRNLFNNPGEGYLGARYQINRDCAILGGLGLGTVNTQAGNDIRVSAGIRFSPMPEPPKPVVAQPAPKPAPVVVAKAPVPFSTKRVIFTPKEIRITEEVKFRNASAVLTPSGRRLLDEVALVMKRNHMSYHKILIEGHTNELGSYPYNQTLSEQRAASVREYLSSRGINTKELLSIGYGKTKPKKGLKGMSKEAKLAANRRVEFKVIN
jgi:OOP family OmpA-OmpF porin